MLFGRSAAVQALGERLDRRSAVVVVGEAGIGKTAVLRAGCAASGRTVFEGGGLSMLSWHPYLPIARAFGAAARGDHAAVADDVARRVDGGVLVLDDLHWADADTLALLPLLAGSVALVAAVRRGDPGTEAALAKVDEAGFERLDLEGLALRDARALVRETNPALSRSAVELVCRAAQGNPLLLQELAVGEPSRTLRLSLRARLRRSSVSARGAIARLALLGRPARSELIGAGVNELLDAGLAVEVNGQLELRHALLGEAALEELTFARRRRLHSELARVLIDPGESARHHQAAGELGAAHEKALRAAEGSRTPGERARHLGLAAACASRPAATRLRLRAADALVAAGEYHSAESLLNDSQETDAEIRAEVHLHRARARFGLSDLEGFERELEAGLALVSGTETPVEARLRIELVELPGWRWDAPRSMELAVEAWELARRTRTEVPRARLLLGQAHFLAFEPEAAVVHLKAARRVARANGEADVELDATSRLAVAHALAGDARAARRAARAVRMRARALRLRAAEQQALYLELFFTSHVDGPTDAVVDGIQTLLAEPAQSLMRDQALGELAGALAERGRPADARSLIERGLPHAKSEHDRSFLLGSLADVEWLCGRLEHAVEVAERVHTTGVAAWAATVRCWALSELGRPIDEHEPGGPHSPGTAETQRALRALVGPGREREAEALFAEAAAAWPERRHALRCLWGAGEAARRAGELDRARKRLLALEAELEERGMVALLARVRRSLRLAGVQGARRPQPSGELSSRETEVLSLVSEGLTSAEIAGLLAVSRSTVEAHVRSAMQKLGARTRAQAAVLAG